jgi:hypothetical protein
MQDTDYIPSLNKPEAINKMAALNFALYLDSNRRQMRSLGTSHHDHEIVSYQAIHDSSLGRLAFSPMCFELEDHHLIPRHEA